MVPSFELQVSSFVGWSFLMRTDQVVLGFIGFIIASDIDPGQRFDELAGMSIVAWLIFSGVSMLREGKTMF